MTDVVSKLGLTQHSSGAIASRGVKDSTMSLKPQEDLGVPDETRRVAMAAFPKGCGTATRPDKLPY
jgi:hypothetical protein